MSLCLSSLNVYYRDVGQLWEIALQAGFFLCPIFYSITLVPEKYVLLYSLNPMTRIIESFRKILYHNALPTLSDLLIPLGGGLLLLFIGYFIFRRLEPRFAEEV